VQDGVIPRTKLPQVLRHVIDVGERYGLRELSMGTSQDYRVAADEGATMVRLGSVLYAG